MQGIATEKVPGGKLVRAKVDFDRSVNEIKITGDFFLHPEESIFHIENAIRGIDRYTSQEEIANKVKDAVISNGIILIGVTEDAIARVVKEAMK